MSSIVIYGDTSGAITLAANATAGTNTQTLPAASGTVMVSGNIPAFSAYLSNNQSVTTDTWTKVQLNTKEFDTANCYSTSTYRFTPNVAGYYQVDASIFFNSSSGNNICIMAVYKNGSNVKQGSFTYPASAPASTVNNMSALIYMNGTTDYIELYGYLSASSLPVFYGSQIGTYFQAFLARAA